MELTAEKGEYAAPSIDVMDGFDLYILSESNLENPDFENGNW